MWRRPRESLGEIPVPKDVLDTVSDYQFQPAIMDACFQCVKGAQVVADDANAAENFYLPVAVDRVRLFEKPGAHLWSHARLIRDDGEIVAGPGTYLNIPKGAKHRFRNNGQETARMLFFFTPAGIEGLFDELAKMQVPAGDFSSVIKALNGLGEGYGVEYLSE